MAAVDATRWLTLGAGDRERLRRAVERALSKRPWAVAAWFYGSAARNRPARDIDVGIAAEPIPDPLHLEAIAAEIADELGLLPTDLDVRLLNGSDPVFLGNVLREGERLFEGDRDKRVGFEVWAMNQWLDFQPVWDRMRRQVLAGWSRG